MAFGPAENTRAPATPRLQPSPRTLGSPSKGCLFYKRTMPRRFPCPDDSSFTVLGTVYWNPEMGVAKYRADFMVRFNQGFWGRGPKGPTRQCLQCKPGDLRLIPGTQIKAERTYSPSLSSDFHTCTVARAPYPPHDTHTAENCACNHTAGCTLKQPGQLGKLPMTGQTSDQLNLGGFKAPR